MLRLLASTVLAAITAALILRAIPTADAGELQNTERELVDALQTQSRTTAKQKKAVGIKQKLGKKGQQNYQFRQGWPKK